jgi:glycosyltransferase involved in cell wall biosynthesis
MNIDVVIPTYNRLWSIQKVIPDYLTKPEVNKIIVVDDGSTDGTFEWLNKLCIDQPKLVLVRHRKRLGACAARNDGAAKVQSPYVFFADDDMVLAPENAFSILIDELINGNAEIIAPILMFPKDVDPEIPITSKKPPTDLLFMYNRMLLERKPIGMLLHTLPSVSFQSAQLPGLMLMRRSVLDKIRYDELLGDNSYRDETDFQLKAISHGFRLLACPKVSLIDLSTYTDKGGCHSANIIRYETSCCHNNWRILRRHRFVLQQIGIQTPIQIMQMLFIIHHFFNLLPRRLVYRFRLKARLFVHSEHAKVF